MGGDSIGSHVWSYNLSFLYFHFAEFIVFHITRNELNQKEHHIKQRFENGLIKRCNFWKRCTRAKSHLKQFLIVCRKTFQYKMILSLSQLNDNKGKHEQRQNKENTKKCAVN